MTRRIGIYPGTFDPVHTGHIAFASAAIKQCALDVVVFLPERIPRYKQGVTSLEHRIAMLHAATADQPQLTARQLPSPQFTVRDTLPEIQAAFPGTTHTLLIGSDVAESLPKWDNIQTLVASMDLAIGLRADSSREAIAAALNPLSATTSVRYTYITTPHADITSSRVREGHGESHWIHPNLHQYIQTHDLYQ